MIQNVSHLLRSRLFLPLFSTQFLGAFNDSLFKQAVVLFVTYQLYSNPAKEFQFSAIAQGLFMLPFFLFSALAGQLADDHDKSRLIRMIKLAEIGIMVLGGAGLLLANVPLMLAAVCAMGIHSTFFGPIKYAILPQHLHGDEVLGGTGMVEASTYLAILLGTIAAGWLSIDQALILTFAVAIIGRIIAGRVPPAPREGAELQINYNPITSSWRLVSATMHIPRLFLAILAISFFWMIGTVLIVLFPPLIKNALAADPRVYSTLTALFSIGIAIGSVAINALLRGDVSARYAPISVLAMGAFVAVFWFLCHEWSADVVSTELMNVGQFLAQPLATPVMVTLLLIAIAGGMFVVPLYAFLTTKCDPAQAARMVAANNIVNSGAMVVGSLIAVGLSAAKIPLVEQVLLSSVMCLVSAWLAMRLYRAERMALAAT